MIQKQSAFVTSDKEVFLTREQAQEHELVQIFASEPIRFREDLTEGEKNAAAKWAANCVSAQRDLVLAALSTRKPRTPKVKPAKKTRSTPIDATKITGPVAAT